MSLAMRPLPIVVSLLSIFCLETVGVAWAEGQGRSTATIAQVTVATAQNPNKAGWDFYKNGQYPQAVTQFKQAIQQNPKNAKPYWGLTLAYNKLQRPTEALQALNQAAKLDPAISFTSPETYNKFRQQLEQKVDRPAAATSTRKPAAKTGSHNEDGWDLYKAGQYQQAAAQFRQATQRNPNNVKPYWGLALTYNKLNRYNEALAALDQAIALDPAITFTTKENYTKFRQAVERKAQTTPGSPSAPSTTQLAALKSGVAYVDPNMTRVVDQAQLQQVAQQMQPFTVKFVVMPTVSGDRQQYARQLFEYLNLTDGALILATQKGVDLYSDRLSPETATELAKTSRIEFTPTSYTPGLVKLAQSVVTEVRQAERTRMDLGVGVLGLIGASGAGFAIHRRKSWKKSLSRVQNLRQEVAQVLDNTEGYTEVLGTGDAADKTRKHRQGAAQEFVEASDILDRPPRNFRELRRAENLLQSSLERLQRVQEVIDRVAKGEAIDEVFTQLFSDDDEFFLDDFDDFSDIEEEETPGSKQAACFFCSRPLAFKQAKPINLSVDRTQHRVLACSNCAAQVRKQHFPPVRAIRQNDQYIPWYRYPDYNPYRDYHSTSYHWHTVSITEVDRPYDYSPDVVIVPDHSEYRDYAAQEVERSSNFWQAGSHSETQRETDFMGSDWGDRESSLGSDQS